MTEEEIREEEVQEQEGDGESAYKEFLHHQRIAIEELGKAIESLFPKSFREHTVNAGQAFVDSFKALFEAAKDDLDQMVNRGKDEESEESGSKVKVDIE